MEEPPTSLKPSETVIFENAVPKTAIPTILALVVDLEYVGANRIISWHEAEANCSDEFDINDAVNKQKKEVGYLDANCADL